MKWLIRLIMRILYIKKKSLFTPIKYGLLYNHFVTTDIRGIVPSGWHLPTLTEKETLRTYLDPLGTSSTNIAGIYLKESGTVYWVPVNTATNSTVYSGRGGGLRNADGTFTALREQHATWTSTIIGSSARGMNLNSGESLPSPLYDRKMGLGIRLIKDDSTNTGSVTDYDGNVYPTVLIGTQVWMAADLIVKHYNNGDIIANITNATDWSNLTTGAWCHYNNDSQYE